MQPSEPRAVVESCMPAQDRFGWYVVMDGQRYFVDWVAVNNELTRGVFRGAPEYVARRMVQAGMIVPE